MNKLPDFLKPVLAKRGDSLRIVYLYREGFAIALFERNTDVGRQEYVKVSAPSTLTSVYGDFRRIVLQPALARIVYTLPGSVSVRAHGASLENGSANTKQAGLRVATLAVCSAHGDYHQSAIPDLMSGDFTVQADVPEETWADIRDRYTWAGHAIVNRDAHLTPETPAVTT